MNKEFLLRTMLKQWDESGHSTAGVENVLSGILYSCSQYRDPELFAEWKEVWHHFLCEIHHPEYEIVLTVGIRRIELGDNAHSSDLLPLVNADILFDIWQNSLQEPPIIENMAQDLVYMTALFSSPYSINETREIIQQMRQIWHDFIFKTGTMEYAEYFNKLLGRGEMLFYERV